MANIPETPEWIDDVIQIEEADKVLGGPDGAVNRQTQQVANRTGFLKQKVEEAAALAAQADGKADQALGQIAAIEEAAGSATEAALDAEQHRLAAETAAALSSQSQQNAAADASQAHSNATYAVQAAGTAQGKAAEAQASATAALGGANVAVGAKDVAIAARDAAMAARDGAIAAKDEAEQIVANVDAVRDEALAARDQAVAAKTEFRNWYYGPLASEPTTRPDGSAMQEGDQYQNTTDHARYTHNGTAWVSDIERIEDLEGLVGTGGRWCGASATAPSTRLDGSPLQEGDEYQNTTGSHLRYNWTGSAWVALNSSAQTLEAELSGADGAEKIVYTRPISGGIARTLEAKLAEDFPTVKDAGAKGDTTTNNSAAIESTMVAGNVHFPTGNFYSISESIKYRSERFVKGEFYGFSGTVLKPTGDFPTFVGTPSTGNYSRVAIRDFQINGENNATCYSIKLHDCFLMELDRIWLRSSFHGVDLQRSNSIVLKDFKVMETPRGDSVNILNCTSIKFISSNFETSVAGQRQTGIFRITSDLGSIANAELHGCQFERTGLKVGAASVKSFGGVLSDCDIDMLDESRSCFVDMEMSGSAMVHDFGMNNVVKNAYCQNMATPQHEWPKLQQATPSTSLTFGAVGEEWVYLVSAGSRSNAALSSGLIEIKDGSTVLASSGAFSFPAYGNSQGLTPRRAKSFLAVVKNPAGASGPIFTNCAGFSLKGGKNLLSNGTFAGGATTGWTLSGVTASASGDDVLLTPSASNWTILQNIDALAKQGKRYILVAKFSGAASLTYGNAMDGSAGARPLADSGVPNLYGDGDTVAMLSFEHYRSLAANISLGRVGSNTPVTVRWIALIEVPN